MPFRPVRALTILVLLAAAFPPPRMATLLIVAAMGDDSADSKKTPQARGRNRIGTPPQPDWVQGLAPRASGEKRPPRSFTRVRLRREPAPITLGPASLAPSLQASLRLRC